MTKVKAWLPAIIAAAIAASPLPALSQGFYTNGVPTAGGTQYPTTLPLTGNERFGVDTMLGSGLNPASEAVSVSQMAAYALGVAGGGGWRNALVGGDFGTNLWQRGTSGTATTTALTYGADRWALLSGTGTEIKMIRSTTAGDLPATGYIAAAKIQRTASQTGVIASCVQQVLTSANSTRFQGQKAEFVFHATAGATFSAASSIITATIATGTGSDESAANFSTGAWTGYAVAVAQPITISTTNGRYSAVATIPATATQVGVKICFTPVGTAGATDYFAFTGAQLDINPGAVAIINSAGTSAGQALSFERRPQSIESMLQYYYYYRLTETVAVTPVAICAVSTTSRGVCLLTFPTTMRTVPTMTYTTGFAMSVAAQTSVVTCTANATSTQVTSSAANIQAVPMTCDSSAGFGAAGTVAQLFSNNGSGVVQASAEL